jgi:hypothetical protein
LSHATSPGLWVSICLMYQYWSIGYGAITKLFFILFFNDLIWIAQRFLRTSICFYCKLDCIYSETLYVVFPDVCRLGPEAHTAYRLPCVESVQLYSNSSFIFLRIDQWHGHVGVKSVWELFKEILLKFLLLRKFCLVHLPISLLVH